MASRSIPFVLIVIVVTLILGIIINYAPGTEEHYSVYITGVEVKRASENSDKYLVYTKDTKGNIQVFENTDALMRGKTNSSDLQAFFSSIKEKDIIINITVVGWRISFLSIYQNIISVEAQTSS